MLVDGDFHQQLAGTELAMARGVFLVDELDSKDRLILM
jgi:hypothetical protein